MASADPLDCEPTTPRESVASDGYERVLGAGGRVDADRGKEGRDESLVAPHGRKEESRDEIIMKLFLVVIACLHAVPSTPRARGQPRQGVRHALLASQRK